MMVGASIAPGWGRGDGQEVRPVIEPSGRGCNPEPPRLSGTFALQGGKEVGVLWVGVMSH